MSLSIIVLDAERNFLQFLDPELCDFTETHAKGGLKAISFEYKFQDIAEDKQLFKIGNKIAILGDEHIKDCLYVINTHVKEDLFKENSFSFDMEEVLVELNNAPLVSHTDFSKNCFLTKTTNDELTVKVDWNSLNAWFGDYFNIGVVQDCLSDYASYIPFTGTMTRMSLLRLIEEETGNIFVTRYEKDCLENVIHCYLDFLNPININRNWTLNLEYTFMGEMVSEFFDDNGDPVPDDNSWDVTRFINTHIEPESQEEIVKPYDAETDEALTQYDVEDPNFEWIPEDNNVVDESLIKHYKSYNDIIAENIEFRIVNSDFEQYTVDGTALKWSSEDVNFGADTGDWVISLMQLGDTLGLCVNETSFAVASNVYTDVVDKYVTAIKEGTLNPIPVDDVHLVLPDGCYFEIYDNEYNQTLFRTEINNQIGKVHNEVLDLGYNVENISLDVDESTTYSAVSPVLALNDNASSSNGLTRSDLTNIINRYTNLEIQKGQTIPMIIQRIQVKKPTLEEAKMSLGGYVEHSGDNQSNSISNWWIRPYHPQDQKNDNDSSQNTWEFLRATAYRKAPYAKQKGLFFIESEKGYSNQYSHIIGRNDNRDDKGAVHSPKMGTTESSDEDIFAIYNQVCSYLKEHETPTVELEVDVANLKGYKYNNYDVHDRIYVKLPDTNELIACEITETHKEVHDMSKNTVKLSNYVPRDSKTVLQETIIHAENTSFTYPHSKKLTVQLENLDYNEDAENRMQYPANKLLSFTLYSVSDGNQTFKKSYTKVTNYQGKASLNMKYGPGDYLIEVYFGGDDEFEETSSTVTISVGGTKAVKTKAKKTTSNKTAKKKVKKVEKTTYYDKYGRSPDKKKVLGIGRISAGGDKGTYKKFYGQEFKNKCPYCGKASLVYQIFWGGEHGDYHKLPVMGNNSKGSNQEGAFFCTNLKTCGADFSAQGNEHISGGKKLTPTKKRFISSKADAKKLMKGKYPYNKKTTSKKQKKVTNTQKRKIIGRPSAKVKEQALAIVKNKIGRAALLEICKWMDKHIHYGPGQDGYSGFQRSPEFVLKTKLCNCCDGTRLFFELCDAAGLCEYYDMYYVNLRCPRYGHVYGRIRTKKTGHWVNIDTASDTYGCYGYVCDSCSRSSPVDSKYPTKPF